MALSGPGSGSSLLIVIMVVLSQFFVMEIIKAGCFGSFIYLFFVKRLKRQEEERQSNQISKENMGIILKCSTI